MGNPRTGEVDTNLKMHPPNDNEGQSSESPKDQERDHQGAHPQPSPDEPSGKSAKKDQPLSLEQLLKQKGQNLRRNLSKLSKYRGGDRTKKLAFSAPTPEQRNELVKSLVGDRHAAVNLRHCLGIGFQLGDLRTADLDGVWAVLMEISELYLRQLTSPSPPGLQGAQGSALVALYRKAWERVVLPDESKKDGKSKLRQKEVDLVRDILLLDATVSCVRGRLTEHELVESFGALLEPVPSMPAIYGPAPWSLASVLAGSGSEPGAVQARKAHTIHDYLARLESSARSKQRTIEEQQEKIQELESEAAATLRALEAKIDQLRVAEEKVVALRNDVSTAGNIGKHMLDETRSRMTGFLGGELERHLKTIEACMDMDPPRSKVAVERVETLLEAIKREISWLQSSA